METVKIIEKPDSISWEEIRQCLIDAHAENRAKGINMTHYQWPAEKIKEFIGDDSVVLVALDGAKLVGVLALNTIVKKKWYVTGKCGYVGFGAVLHEYNGQGIFRKLYDTIEEKARKNEEEALITAKELEAPEEKEAEETAEAEEAVEIPEGVEVKTYEEISEEETAAEDAPAEEEKAEEVQVVEVKVENTVEEEVSETTETEPEKEDN